MHSQKVRTQFLIGIRKMSLSCAIRLEAAGIRTMQMCGTFENRKGIWTMGPDTFRSLMHQSPVDELIE
jgi:hypothetical protein